MNVVAFDCDATLTGLEGIDWLAERAGVGREIAAVTRRAMSGEVPLEEVYESRLREVQPGPEDLAALAEAYAAHTTEDAAATIAALDALGWEVWVVSGGLLPAVAPFAETLGVAPMRVRAVPLDWSADDPWACAAAHPLATTRGKRGALAEAAASGGPPVLVGDGASDLACADVVSCLVGYGGVVAQDSMRRAAAAWIGCPSLAPVLPLVLGPEGGRALASTPHAATWARGAALVAAGRASGGCPGAPDSG